eukprot:259462_1
MATSLTVVNLIDELLQLFTQDSQRPDCLAKNTFNITFTSEDNKKYNQITKDIMIGYVKHIQSLLKNYDIPPLIIHICLQYYDNCYLEVFTKIGNNLNINKQFNTIENKLCNKWGTAYGNMEINNKNIDNINIYIWTFKIPQNNMFGDYNHLCLGIDSSNRKYGFCNFSDRSRNKYNFYSYSSDGTKISHCTAEQPYGGRDFTCGNNCRIGYSDATNIFDAEIKMEINIPQKILKFYHKISWRFVDAGIAFSNIDFDTDNTYHLAISLKKGTGIELIDFKKNEVH